MFLSAFPIGTPYECRCRLGRRQCLAMRSASSSFEGLQISRSSPIATSWAEADFVMILSSCVRFAFRDLPSGALETLEDWSISSNFLSLSACRSLAVASSPPASRPAGRGPAVAVVQPLSAGRLSDLHVIFNHVRCVWRCPGFGSQQI